jgi:hypothetical protein
VKLSSWPEIGSDGDVLLTPYVPKGITGYDDDEHKLLEKQISFVFTTKNKATCFDLVDHDKGLPDNCVQLSHNMDRNKRDRHYYTLKCVLLWLCIER